MELEKELSEFSALATKSENRIRELLGQCCPYSLRQACQKFCCGLSYGGTIAADNEQSLRQQLDWNGYFQFTTIGNQHDIYPNYIFHMRYFGGNFAFLAKYASEAGYGLVRQNPVNGSWSNSTGNLSVKEEMQQCMASLKKEALSRFFQESASVFERVESDLLQFMREKIREYGKDAEYLFHQAHRWFSSQREMLARYETAKAEKNLLEKRIGHIQNEMREIVAGIGASKSFAKSKALKSLRERGEELLRELDK